MARKQKPAEKRRMRQQLVATQREIERLETVAKKHAGEYTGRLLKERLDDARKSAEILRLYV